MNHEKFVNVDGIRTRYYEEGAGQAMVLFHGGNFGQQDNIDCAENWDLNWDGFKKNFHVLAIDKLGQGFTDNPRNDDYTVEAVVGHAYGFIEALGLRKFHLVGHSRGGYLVTRLALEHPDSVSTLTIVDSQTTAPGANTRRGPLLAAAPRPLLSRESIRWVTQQFSSTYEHITESWMDVRERIAKLPKNAEAVSKMATLDQERFLPSLFKQKEETLAWIKEGRLKLPTLLVWGYNDPSALFALGTELFDIVSSSASRCQMHIFNKAGHYSYREHPQDFVRVVSDFVGVSAK
jgi:2-hydroxy-6-oxonona-2,4-dienedioate hydrolase